MRKHLMVAAVIGMVAAQGWGPPAQAAGGNGGGNNSGGFVSGHTEGQPPIDGRLCVTYIQGVSPHTECKTFTSGGPNDIAISIPENGLASATFTVLVGDGSGPAGYSATYDQLSGDACTGKAVTAPAGMALCQSIAPAYEQQVHRFNTIWNTNSAANGTPGKACRPGSDGQAAC